MRIRLPLMPVRSFSLVTPAFAALWLILLLPDLSARYSFGWDSSQFARGVEHFDIAAHQPHPPGYPLWVMSARVLTPVAGNPYRAQIVLALLFTIGGLFLLRAAALRIFSGDERTALGATLLAAFSPVVCLYANSSQVYAVDLFASCLGGWLAAALWSGAWGPRLLLGFAGIALSAGFRPSGATFVLPLLGIALLWRTRDIGRIVQAVAVTGAIWLAWLTPTAMSVGGFQALSQLNSVQASTSFAKTSVFFGAPPIVHAHMIAEVCIYFAIALSGFAIPVVMRLFMRGREFAAAAAVPWWFFALWMGPCLGLVFALHCSQPGYVILAVPPLALLLARTMPGAGTPVIAAGVAFSLLVTYLPYERLMDPARHTLPFLFLRATPRISRMVESTQREIREAIDRNVPPPAGGQKRKMFCFFHRFEAPNIRTLTYDFRDIDWAVLESQPANARPDAWLCDGGGLPAAVRAAFPAARQVAGTRFYSLWLPGQAAR
jgi:hypothetical protein